MRNEPTSTGGHGRVFTRREILRGLGALGLLHLSGCATLELGLGLHSDRFEEDADLTRSYLEAFAATVVPGCPGGATCPGQALVDPDFPLADHAPWLLDDLRERSRARGAEFPGLSPEDRQAVVAEGVGASGVTSRVYTGAVFLTQIAAFSALYDESGAAPLIDFPGPNRGYRRSEITYPEPEEFLGRERSATGNPW